MAYKKHTIITVKFTKKLQDNLSTVNFALVTFCKLNCPFLFSSPSSQGWSCVWEHSVPDPKAAGVGPSAKAYCRRGAGVAQCRHCLVVIAPSAGCLQKLHTLISHVELIHPVLLNHYLRVLIAGSLFHHWVAPCKWCQILTIKSIILNICKRWIAWHCRSKYAMWNQEQLK